MTADPLSIPARRAEAASVTLDGDGDDDVVARAQGGDAAAFEALVRRYGGAVLAVVERRVGDGHRAADLAQDAWVKVHRGLGGFRGSSFRSWLFAVVLNQVRDGQKAEARRPTVPLADDFEASVPSHERAGDEQDAVHAALSRVDEPFRTAVSLVDLAGLSYGEAATSLGCTTGTVKSRVHRGRLAFRDAYVALTSPRARSTRPDLSPTGSDGAHR